MRMHWVNLALTAAAAATTVTDDPAIASDKTFDFVVVGAGLAGITVANKVRIHNNALSSRVKLTKSRYSSVGREILYSSLRLVRMAHGIQRFTMLKTARTQLCSAIGIIRDTMMMEQSITRL